jgi:hypothetical protein
VNTSACICYSICHDFTSETFLFQSVHYSYFISSGESVTPPRTSKAANHVWSNKSRLLKRSSMQLLNLNMFFLFL